MLSYYDDEKRQELDRLNQTKVKRLKKTVAKINWKMEEERRDFHRRLCPFISDWESPFPDLRDIFNRNQIEWLFMEDVNKSNYGTANFVDFAIKAGYIDNFFVIKNDKPILRRVTAVHHAARNPKCTREVVDSLFKIYNKFDRNYIDEEFGLTHFQVACMSGCVEAVEKFLELGQDPNLYPMAKFDATKSVDPPLHLALEHKHAKIVELLLKKGANPSLVNVNGLTPLHVVGQKADEDDDKFLELFFKICEENQRAVQIDARDKLGNTPLHLALIRGKKKVAELLLRKGANASLATEDGYSPLHLIGKYIDDDDLPEMFFKVCDELQLKVKVDARDKSGNTPLHLALMHEHKWVAESLLKHGAVPALANDNGKTALLLICEKGTSMDIDSMEMLHAYSDKRRWPLLIDGRDASIFDDNEWTSRWRVDARDESGRTPLHLALVHDRLDAVEWLLRHGADPNATDEDGSTLLHILSQRSSDIDLVKTFFEICDKVGQPLQVDARDNWRRTPLHLALTYGRVEMAEVLLRRGADPSLATNQGSTPLHIICQKKKDHHSAKMLFDICDELNKSVDVNAQDTSYRTPLSLALMYGDEELVKLLLRRGAHLNTVDDDGLTVLHLICRREYDIEMAKLLFGIADEKHQLVQVNRKDKWSRTPLQYAVANLFPEMIDILLDRGADLSSFVFPTRLDFVWFSRPHVYKRQKFMNGKTRRDFEFEVAMPLVLESLEKRGFQLGRYGALTIIQILDLKIFDEPRPVETYRRRNYENFASKAMITPHEMQKWREFFLRWAVEFFWTLTRYRLSKSSCKRIVERLTNVDLVNICLTGKGPDRPEEQEFQYRRLWPRIPPRQEGSGFDSMPFYEKERFYM